MNRIWWILVLGWMIAFQVAHAQGAMQQEFNAEMPPCKKSAIKRPMLRAEQGVQSKESIKTGWYSPLVVDFNGDGWCDFAWAIPYPVNSKMESYWLEDMLILGGPKKWRMPFNGKRPSVLRIDIEMWPIQNVALTDIAMVSTTTGGAPYVLGIGPDGHKQVGFGCYDYASVHRWDNTVDAFKRADEAMRDAVLSFYYSHIGKRCERPAK